MRCRRRLLRLDRRRLLRLDRRRLLRPDRRRLLRPDPRRLPQTDPRRLPRTDPRRLRRLALRHLPRPGPRRLPRRRARLYPPRRQRHQFPRSRLYRRWKNRCCRRQPGPSRPSHRDKIDVASHRSFGMSSLRHAKNPSLGTRTRGRCRALRSERPTAVSPSARREKLQPSVGLLAREAQTAELAICRHPLPSPTVRSSGFSRAASTHSGGTAPASTGFPVTPDLGTEGTYSVFKNYRLLQPSRAEPVKSRRDRGQRC
jgi:hypothetical protein